MQVVRDLTIWTFAAPLYYEPPDTCITEGGLPTSAAQDLYQFTAIEEPVAVVRSRITVPLGRDLTRTFKR